MPQASLVAPQAVPTETFAILVNPSPNLGSFAAVLSTAGKCDTARFSYFPETRLLKVIPKIHRSTACLSPGSRVNRDLLVQSAEVRR